MRFTVTEVTSMGKNIFFTADHHFGHANIIKFCNRPFIDVNQMNSVLIAKWNDTVNNSDIVYYLGDFSLGSFSYVQKIFSQLNGHIHIIPGSHDYWIKKSKQDQLKSKNGRTVKILERIVDLKLDFHKKKYYIVLCHYCLRTWSRSHYGSWHLYAHSHNSLKEDDSLSFDVGVDCWNYAPVGFHQIIDKMDVKIKKNYL